MTDDASLPPIEQLARITSLEVEVARLRQELEIIKTFERYRDAILARHPVEDQVVYSRSARIDAREFLDAESGFHPLEYGADGLAYRWSGPQPEARLSVWVDRSQPLVMRICSHDFGLSTHVMISVDGHAFQVHRPNGVEVMSLGPIPPRSQAGPTEIVLTPETMFSPAEKGSADTRILGFTLIWLELGPFLA